MKKKKLTITIVSIIALAIMLVQPSFLNVYAKEYKVEDVTLDSTMLNEGDVLVYPEWGNQNMNIRYLYENGNVLMNLNKPQGDSYTIPAYDSFFSTFEIPAGKVFVGWCVVEKPNEETGELRWDLKRCIQDDTPATPAPTNTPAITPTAVPTQVPTATPVPTPTAVPTQVPTATPIATPTAVPTQAPTAAPVPTPTAVPTQAPTATPVPTPTAVPTQAPTATPVPTPTAVPTQAPTAAPVATSTAVPTQAPTAAPVPTPTAVPAQTPTAAPSVTPTVVPTDTPTAVPTATPIAVPTQAPTAIPTVTPSEMPTIVPTPTPTNPDYTNTVISQAGTYELQPYMLYLLRGSVTYVEGDITHYANPIDFTVETAGTYNFY